MTAFAVAALSLMLLLAASAAIAAVVLRVAQNAFDVALGAQHEDDPSSFEKEPKRPVVDWD